MKRLGVATRVAAIATATRYANAVGASVVLATAAFAVVVLTALTAPTIAVVFAASARADFWQKRAWLPLLRSLL